MWYTKLIVGAACCVGIIGCQSEADRAYEQRVLQHRGKITYNFLDETVSPLPQEQRKSFKGLAYFPVAKQFVVSATFTRNTAAKPIELPHTRNRTYTYLPIGTLRFELHNKNIQLMAYVQPQQAFLDSVTLIVPFTDLTTGKTTYGGGRLLDIPAVLSNGIILVDFNYSYFPYCAHNPEYSCPIPPKQNHLPIAIEAGEKIGSN